MSDFHIRIANDDLVFCAAHFLALEGGRCERLHGHSYRVAVEVDGPLNDSHYVIDFLTVRDALKNVLAGLDHRVLLPTEHTAIRVSAHNNQVEATFADRCWRFPEDDCILLPVANTTTELLAQYIGEQLAATIRPSTGMASGRLQIEVAEGSGFSAVCSMRW